MLTMSKAPLVRASRDGDQFHYLWAARRCLQLLTPTTDLVAITIEGPSPLELPAIATDDPHLDQSQFDEDQTDDRDEVIDVAEYYGSEELLDAREVRYVQLKHSTLKPEVPWPPSGLRQTIVAFARNRPGSPSCAA